MGRPSKTPASVSELLSSVSANSTEQGSSTSSTSSTSGTSSTNSTTELAMLKAQNDVLLALIKGYFDTNTQALATVGTLLTEALKLGKDAIQDQSDIRKTSTELQMNIEQLRVENDFEIAKLKLELEADRLQLDARRLELQRLAEQANESYRVMELELSVNGRLSDSRVSNAVAEAPSKLKAKKQATPSIEEISKSVDASVGSWDGSTAFDENQKAVIYEKKTEMTAKTLQAAAKKKKN